MRKLIIAGFVLLTCLPVLAQMSQGTAFTCGQLSQAGTPIIGNVDLVFALSMQRPAAIRSVRRLSSR